MSISNFYKSVSYLLRVTSKIEDLKKNCTSFGQVADLDRYILVGDTFGANIAIAYSSRKPPGLEALVLSGGFAADPITNPLTKLKLTAASFLPGDLYQQVTLRFHAQSLASPFNADGQVPLSQSAIRKLFIQNTPRRSYLSRMKAAFSANYLHKLERIQVPICAAIARSITYMALSRDICFFLHSGPQKA